MHPETRAARLAAPAPGQPVAVPLYQSSNFRFESPQQLAEAMTDPDSFAYSGYANPTNRALEQAMADLEGGEKSLVTASGSSAIAVSLQTILQHGDHIIAQKALYGGTVAIFNQLVEKWGIEVTYIDGVDANEVRQALRPKTKLLYLETIANPIGHVPDIPALAAEAKQNGLLTAVDSTFATPLLCRPIEYGADIVIHSATKYLGGHHDVVGGVAVFAGNALYRQAQQQAVKLGVVADPFAAWLIIRGLKTLPLRIARACESAARLAERMAAHPAVSVVHYPGLPTHSSHARATKLLSAYGATIAVEVHKAQRFMSNLELIMNAPSLGGTDSTAMHPATTSHRHLNADELRTAGVSQDMVRIAVGVEHPDDLWADIEQALSPKRT
ncbi:aminotransferase class I/II-fold pyridoxal phosphate-dependent enzyme [Kibdelosporangium philippinense]|uniref:Aminotransferase class I/II-fold pyridoxal phosphate-dependent enzyme n=1 Tax=Kibdelosporangium philippinense TaxID=211113 RepID=A0ABS8Z441_9PSEU|nr:aminotransferase class I/II-fold pyridoxal phosphate-dependent enzyme [Kibdelosporangium philippinense]MCE7002686.1 aminotransferase class I/II-fold pyridoxal phosphate-dependent enzyme [Kibdelosporangium philippinense]